MAHKTLPNSGPSDEDAAVPFFTADDLKQLDEHVRDLVSLDELVSTEADCEMVDRRAIVHFLDPIVAALQEFVARIENQYKQRRIEEKYGRRLEGGVK